MLSLEINMNRKPLKVTQLRLQGHNVFKCYANIVYIKYFYKCRGRRWYKTALVQQNCMLILSRHQLSADNIYTVTKTHHEEAANASCT